MQTDNRPNSEVFIDLFTEIEQKLKEICGDTYHSNFSELLRRARNINPILHQFANDLREYAQLRNAIIHTRRENFIIAEPHNDVIKEIRRIRNLLYNPPKVSSIIKGVAYIATPKTPIMEMLETFANKGFMRCPVVDGNKVICLITAKTLARWIITNPSNFQNASLEAVIPFADQSDYTIVSENTDIVSIVGQFKNAIKKGTYIQAVLITKNGLANSPLVGILTPSDLPRLMEMIDEK
ncbi:MAG: CBS domain-containing protein [Bacteroidales bacterium]|nr:MAG: CBS domain-containing protein [Bacteroidales bacterium]